MRTLKVFGLALLLAGCAPKNDIIYISAGIDHPNRITYSVSDPDDQIKAEILRAQESQGQLLYPFLEAIMEETSQRGIVVQVEEVGGITAILVYGTILHIKGRGAKASIRTEVTFYDRDQNGRLDLPPKTRRMLENSIKACELVLRDYQNRRR